MNEATKPLSEKVKLGACCTPKDSRYGEHEYIEICACKLDEVVEEAIKAERARKAGILTNLKKLKEILDGADTVQTITGYTKAHEAAFQAKGYLDSLLQSWECEK